ncbi:MAG: (Fe-S)-binding protein [Candidatus Thorarchaeota archaeon]|nr:MAG: (Fe-S)-binding protein [Candidatus Thorarchaeota archaeon]
MGEEEAYEFVTSTLEKERIEPYTREESEVVHSVQQCINCGICLSHCPVVAAVGIYRFSGPRSIAVELSRSPPEFWATGDTIYLCTGCGTCMEVCPKNVNIPEIVNMMRSRILRFRPDLVPKGLHVVRETILEHNLAFVPLEDVEDKTESRDMRLEHYGLPLIETPEEAKSEVLYYPGCQAEERSQEVREAAKIILDRFEVGFTMLEDMCCCGLPSRLMGDKDTAEKLASRLKQRIDELDIKKIVTTCAGCTSNIGDASFAYDWNVPVLHLVEFLTDEVGTDKLAKAFTKPRGKEKVKVTVHDPCHLIRHTSRQLMDKALLLLDLIPDVKVEVSTAADSCCGGGGLVAYHSKDVSKAVVKENLEAIRLLEAQRVVTPCPLCTAQLEDNLFQSGSSIEVDDLTVFIAQRLSNKG